MAGVLEERLKSHAKAFDGLLSIIPARHYFGKDTDDQWQRKKQSKEEAGRAKLAKFDPNNAKSAKDVLDENARKRKREDDIHEDIKLDVVTTEKPREGLKVVGKKVKKQKVEASSQVDDTRSSAQDQSNKGKVELSSEAIRHKAEKRRAKRERRKAKDAKKAEKKAKKGQMVTSAKIVNIPDDENSHNISKNKQDVDNTINSEEENNDDAQGAEEKIEKEQEKNKDEDAQRVGRESYSTAIIHHHKETSQSGKAVERGGNAQSSREIQSNTEADASKDMPTQDADAHGENKDKEAQGSGESTIDVDGTFEDFCGQPSSTATASPTLHPIVFDVSAIQSGTSSISSIVPNNITTIERQDQRVEDAKRPKADPEELKRRFQERIDALRAARKADGPNGAPARNRQELMEARRRKEEQRKAHKKELRAKAKEEEQQKQEQLIARGSPLLSPAAGSSSSPFPKRDVNPPNSFSFGRVAFEDGQHMDAGLSTILDAQKRKGPQDPATAMKSVEKKQARVASLDPTKRSNIEEKDLWLNAKKRAHGERIRDDTSLLKKTLKRKEKAKKKSEQEWNERIENVQKGQHMKQKKREGNLQKRKDEKGGKGKKNSGKGAQKAKLKPKPRPGFEGSFRSKVGGGGAKKK